MKKIILGFSGGVDSTAALFKFLDDGYNVIPIFFILSKSQLERAEYVRDFCSSYSLEYIIADETELFSNSVVKYFASAYTGGTTPNPCAMCNRMIKFPLLKSYMEKNGCIGFSTGHYIKVQNGCIYKPEDDEKDQTYFTASVKKEHLEFYINPITSYMKKNDIRAYLKGKKIEAVESKESNEICFVKGEYSEFLVENGFACEEEGEVIDESGRVIGKHKGSFRYTIGKRIGLQGGNPERLYVKFIDSGKNAVYVSKASGLISETMKVELIEKFEKRMPEKLFVKTRYRQKEIECKILKEEAGILTVEFLESAEAVTPGQIAVFYDSDKVIMSGTILRNL